MYQTVYAASTIPAPPAGAAGVQQLQDLIQRIINISVELAFIASLIVLAWGGIKYITSGGDAKNIENANRTVEWALLGILFLVIAFLVLLVIKAFTGVNVLNFCIGFPGATITGGCS